MCFILENQNCCGVALIFRCLFMQGENSCSHVSMSGWCLFQSQYFLVLIHSRVPVVHQCGQPRTGAHGVLICQDVTSSGPEGKREGWGGGSSLDGKKTDDTQQSMLMCPVVHEYTHTHTHMHASVQKHTQSMSVSQSMSTWETQLLPFISPKTSQHSSLSSTTVHCHCSTSYSHSATGSSWPQDGAWWGWPASYVLEINQSDSLISLLYYCTKCRSYCTAFYLSHLSDYSECILDVLWL